MIKKIITGTILLLAIMVRLSAEESAPRAAHGIASDKPLVQQKGLKKGSTTRHQLRPVHQKHDRHLARVVKRVIRHKDLRDRRATPGLPPADETAVGHLSETAVGHLSETADNHLSADFGKHKGQL